MKDGFWVTVGGALWIVLFLYAELFGLFHAFQKHDGMTAFFIPPVAWYRSIEFWWHDDFADVNWNERIDEDASLVAAAIRARMEDDPDATASYIRIVEQFKERTRHYPAERMAELRRISETYCEYSILLAHDLERALSESLENGGPVSYRPSLRIMEIAARLEPYPQVNLRVSQEIESMEIFNTLSEEDFSIEKKEAAIRAMRMAYGQNKAAIFQVHEKLFGRTLELRNVP